MSNLSAIRCRTEKEQLGPKLGPRFGKWKDADRSVFHHRSIIEYTPECLEHFAAVCPRTIDDCRPLCCGGA